MNARLRGLADMLNGRPMVRVVVPVLVLVLLATVIATNPTGRPVSTSAPGSGIAEASPTIGPDGSPVPSEPAEPPEPWEDLVLGPIETLAAITPVRQDRVGVATSSGFRLRSLGDIAATVLAKGVETSPPIQFRVREGEQPDVAILDPVAPLREGQLYRFRLIGPNGALGGSWAFQTQAPLQVLNTIPGDEATEVPVDTGIEVTFDQDGLGEIADHFTIEPAVTGRFELHGRTWAFVPDRPLEPSTAYRVTVSSGVGLDGSAQQLEQGVTFRFETEPPPGPRELQVSFSDALAGVRPGDEPSLLLDRYNRRDGIDTLPVRIYRLPDLETTLAAAKRITGPNRWLRASGAGLYPVDGLDRVASLDAPLRHALYNTLILDLPVQLDRGAYIVMIPRRTGAAQSILQVGNLSAYATTSDTSTVVWVNDLAGPTPIAAATVSAADGRRLGATSSSGLAEFETPASLIPVPDAEDDWSPDARLLSIESPDGRWLVAALGSDVSWLEGGADSNFSQAAQPSERWWLLLNTDREEYSQTDTINIWGRASSRDDGSPARGVELRLRAARGDVDVDIARIPVELTRRGTFTGSIPISSLPRAGYRVDLLIGGRRATSTWIYVGQVVKPAYRFEVQTDRHAYLDGDPIAVTIRATFFDGTGVPSLDLKVKSTGVPGTTLTTDSEGFARITVEARFTHDRPSGWDGQSIHVTPARPEEGEISESTSVIVFPTEAWLTAKGSMSGTTLSVSGSLTAIDFSGLNAAYEAGWRWPSYRDIAGTPLRNQNVAVTVTRVQYVKRQSGTYYDFIEKKVTIRYVWHRVETVVGTFNVRTGSDGRYGVNVRVPSATDGYEIGIRSTDDVGRLIVDRGFVEETRSPGPSSGPSFLIRGYCGSTTGFLQVGLDERYELTMHDGDGSIAREGRFLWLVSNRGLREVESGTSPSFSSVARASVLPRFSVRGVQVTRAGYVVADAHVSFDLDDLRIEVQVKADQARYTPGSRASVDIRTLGPDGRPVAADVVVQGIDEKLYAAGAAREVRVLDELHGWVSSGMLQSFASHRIAARLEAGGCGATGGGRGDVRDDFGDVVVFDLVHTDSDGRATVSFDLLDDLTSWRVSAMALTSDYQAGSGSALLPVGLPFFVEGVLAPEYLVGDAPVLRVRAYGDALDAGDAVQFTVHAPSLGIEDSGASGTAFTAARIALPELPVGTHRIRISAAGPGGRTDAVIRTIRVVPSRLKTLIRQYDALTPSFQPKGGDGLTTYTITDAGRGALIPLLLDLASTTSSRYDGLAAADAARELLIDEFGFDPDELPAVAFDPASFEHRGIALLPYASRDPELTALAALTVPERVNIDSVRSYLRDRSASDRSTREGRIMALAGLAGIGEPVLADLQALAAEDLTIREWLWLALGLAAAGDENGARDIERRLLDEFGQRLGPWVRLKVGGTIDDTHNAGRLLLVLSARLGEDFARDVLAYLDHEGSSERLIALEQLAYVRALLERLPREASRFAWTVDGERHEVELTRGRSTSLALTREQREGFELEPISGELVVVTSWTGPGPLPTGNEASIVRTITPATNVTEGMLVRVTITTTFGAQAPDGCWQVTDLVPSGLAPIAQPGRWPGGEAIANGPYAMHGQRVSWCAYPRENDYRTLSYLARVVTPGTYLWEPALIQSDAAPEVGFATDQLTFTIQ